MSSKGIWWLNEQIWEISECTLVWYAWPNMVDCMIIAVVLQVKTTSTLIIEKINHKMIWGL